MGYVYRSLKSFAFLALLLPVKVSYCQRVIWNNDTVFVDKLPALLCKKGDDQKRFEIMDLHGRQLIDIHNSRVQIDDKTSYVVTFLNDQKQTMIVEQAPFPLSLLNDMLKNELIIKNEIDPITEATYVAAHPLPGGYIDVDQIANY
jgi:hypothetical protein